MTAAYSFGSIFAPLDLRPAPEAIREKLSEPGFNEDLGVRLAERCHLWSYIIASREAAPFRREREKLRFQGRRRTCTGAFSVLISFFIFHVLVFVRTSHGRSFGVYVRDDAFYDILDYFILLRGGWTLPLKDPAVCTGGAI